MFVHVLAVLAVTVAASAEPIIGIAEPIELTPTDGLARYSNSFDQPEGFVQTCFAIEGVPTWRREQWRDLTIPAGGAVIYKFAARDPIARAVLSFGAWGASNSDIRVDASPDGDTWTRLFTYDERVMGSGNRIRFSPSLAPVLSPDRKEFYVRFAPVAAGMILYEFGVRATFGEDRASHADQYLPGRVPPAGRMRYLFNYRGADMDVMEFIRDAWINLFHYHGPFYGYDGLPDPGTLEWRIVQLRETTRQAHENGAMILFYVGPVFSYGDREKRTQIFRMYDEQWEEYEGYLGPRPLQGPIHWTQRDAEGGPIPYVWKEDHGYYLCPSNPATRQYVKGLLRLISTCGADGVFYDGPAFKRGVCHCPHCVEAFREYLTTEFSAQQRQDLFGIEDPSTAQPPTQPGTPLHIAWRRHHALMLQDFLRDTRDSIRAIDPEFVMTANYCMWEGNPFGPLRGSSQDLELWSQVLDVVFEEGCFEKTPRTDGGVKYSNAANYKYLLAASHGKPVAELAYLTEGADEEAQANLVRVAVAEGLMGGGAWQIPYSQTSALGRRAIAERHVFQRENEGLLVGQRPYIGVAVLASMTQGYCGRPSYPMAVSRFLTDHQIDHVMVIDEDLGGALPAGCEVLILPETPCLSDAQLGSLIEFAQEHTLVLLGPCGTRDEWDRERELPLGRRLLSSGAADALSLPHADLPAVGRKGLAAAQEEALAPLLQTLNRRRRPVALFADSSVEFAAYLARDHTLLMHLVNFDVGLDGVVRDKEDLTVRVKLPVDWAPLSVELRSPDFPTSALAHEVFETGGGAEIVLTIPLLHIHGLIVIESAVMTSARRGVPRVEVRGDQSVVLGGRAEVEVSVVAPAGTPAGDIQVHAGGPPGMTIEEIGGGAVSSRGETVMTRVYRIAPPPDAPVGRPVRAQFSVELPGGGSRGGLRAPALLMVAPPATVRLVAPRHLNTLTHATRVALVVENQSTARMDAKVWFAACEGWRFIPRDDRAKIEPGGSHAFTSLLVGEEIPTEPVPIRARLSAFVSGALWVEDLAAECAAPEGVRQIACPRAPMPIHPDGRLRERAWRALPPLRLVSCAEGAPPSQPTDAYTAWDDQHLYFAFVCHEESMASLRCAITEPGGAVWRDDDVEIFLDPDDGRTGYAHIAVNAVGAVYAKPKLPGVLADVRREADRWVVEVAVPLAALGCGVGDGSVWAFNLCRTRHPRGDDESAELSALYPTGGGFHTPARFGDIVLTEELPTEP